MITRILQITTDIPDSRIQQALALELAHKDVFHAPEAAGGDGALLRIGGKRAAGCCCCCCYCRGSSGGGGAALGCVEGETCWAGEDVEEAVQEGHVCRHGCGAGEDEEKEEGDEKGNGGDGEEDGAGGEGAQVCEFIFRCLDLGS